MFKIASVSKLYTAVAIARLVYDGRISLDKMLADYFPELVGRIENADKITVRMMVQHRSGIPNYTDTKNYWVHPKQSDKERLDLVLDLPAYFEPDTDFKGCFAKPSNPSFCCIQQRKRLSYYQKGLLIAQ